MTKQQSFRKWMNRVHKEHGKNRSEFDYDSFSAGWNQALKEVKIILFEVYSKDEVKFIFNLMDRVE